MSNENLRHSGYLEIATKNLSVLCSSLHPKQSKASPVSLCLFVPKTSHKLQKSGNNLGRFFTAASPHRPVETVCVQYMYPCNFPLATPHNKSRAKTSTQRVYHHAPSTSPLCAYKFLPTPTLFLPFLHGLPIFFPKEDEIGAYSLRDESSSLILHPSS
jgi:hypothetical protein